MIEAKEIFSLFQLLMMILLNHECHIVKITPNEARTVTVCFGKRCPRMLYGYIKFPPSSSFSRRSKRISKLERKKDQKDIVFT